MQFKLHPVQQRIYHGRRKLCGIPLWNLELCLLLPIFSLYCLLARLHLKSWYITLWSLYYAWKLHEFHALYRMHRWSLYSLCEWLCHLWRNLRLWFPELPRMHGRSFLHKLYLPIHPCIRKWRRVHPHVHCKPLQRLELCWMLWSQPMFSLCSGLLPWWKRSMHA